MVQENVLEKVGSSEMVVHVVWTPVLGSDSYEAAVGSSRKFLQDPRSIHYWDGERHLGLLYGKVLALPEGHSLAWDIYLAFEAGIEWGEEAPVPTEWVHQLGRDDRHLGDGERYRRVVEDLLSAHASTEPGH